MCRSFCLLAALVSSVHPASGFSNGKVSVACGDMTPQHGHQSSPAPPPFSITVDTSTFSPHGNITVSLQTSSSNPTFFKGFLMEARDAGNLNSPAVGSFILTDPHESQLLHCGLSQGSGVSHRRSTRKTHVQVVWESPEKPPERVQFLVTVVHEYKVYWVRTAGPVVSLRGATAPPPTAPPPTGPPPTGPPSTGPPPTAPPPTGPPPTAPPPTAPPPTAPPAQTTSPTPLSTPFSSVGCGHRKSCLRDPVDCQPESDPHCFFLSFTNDQEGRSVQFELSGPAEGYLSFALSLDKWMGNDDVYLCVNDGGGVTISAAYVTGRTHPELSTQEGLWGRAWRLADGVIQCRFHRNVSVPQQSSRFSLNQSYFLFLAHGRSHQGLIHRHDLQPLISTNQKVITGRPEDLCGSHSPLLIKVHGVVMLTVWMWMVSTAIFIARHYKHLWPDAALLGQRPWFQLHRSMMLLAVVLTAVAFTLPFIYRRGWSKRAGAHPYIGCTVMFLSAVQLTIAALRPAPETPRRIVFNWMHFGTGVVVHILAVLCVFLGAAQQALLLPNPWSAALLTGWLLWIVLVNLLLHIHSCRIRRRGNVHSDDKEILFVQSERQHEEMPTVQKVVLVVFFMGNTTFLAALIKVIASV